MNQYLQKSLILNTSCHNSGFLRTNTDWVIVLSDLFGIRRHVREHFAKYAITRCVCSQKCDFRGPSPPCWLVNLELAKVGTMLRKLLNRPFVRLGMLCVVCMLAAQRGVLEFARSDMSWCYGIDLSLVAGTLHTYLWIFYLRSHIEGNVSPNKKKHWFWFCIEDRIAIRICWVWSSYRLCCMYGFSFWSAVGHKP